MPDLPRSAQRLSDGIANRQILPGAVRTNLPFDLAPVLMI
jgi:hypothetical protein